MDHFRPDRLGLSTSRAEPRTQSQHWLSSGSASRAQQPAGVGLSLANDFTPPDTNPELIAVFSDNNDRHRKRYHCSSRNVGRVLPLCALYLIAQNSSCLATLKHPRHSQTCSHPSNPS